MFDTLEQIIEFIQGLTMKIDWTGLEPMIYKMPPNYCQYHNDNRAYKVGEVFNYKGVKYLVKEQVVVVEGVPQDLTDGNIYSPIQSSKLSLWVLNEWLPKGANRISPSDNMIYTTNKYVPKAGVDPSLSKNDNWIYDESLNIIE